MFRGRHQIGTHMPLGVLVRNSAGVPTAPDAAPTMVVYAEAGTKVKEKQIPCYDTPAVTGLFQVLQFLGPDFPVGRYCVTYRWLIGGVFGMEHDVFEVIPGGNGEGAVVALYEFLRPHAQFLVHALDSGKLKRGRNPRL